MVYCDAVLDLLRAEKIDPRAIVVVEELMKQIAAADVMPPALDDQSPAPPER